MLVVANNPVPSDTLSVATARSPDFRDAMVPQPDSLESLYRSVRETLQAVGTAIIKPEIVASYLPEITARLPDLQRLGCGGVPLLNAHNYTRDTVHSFCILSGDESEAKRMREPAPTELVAAATADEVLVEIRSLAGMNFPLRRSRLEVLAYLDRISEHSHLHEKFSGVLHLTKAEQGGEYGYALRDSEERRSAVCEPGTLVLGLGTTPHEVKPVLSGTRRSLVWHFGEIPSTAGL